LSISPSPRRTPSNGWSRLPGFELDARLSAVWREYGLGRGRRGGWRRGCGGSSRRRRSRRCFHGCIWSGRYRDGLLNFLIVPSGQGCTW